MSTKTVIVPCFQSGGGTCQRAEGWHVRERENGTGNWAKEEECPWFKTREEARQYLRAKSRPKQDLTNAM